MRTQADGASGSSDSSLYTRSASTETSLLTICRTASAHRKASEMAIRRFAESSAGVVERALPVVKLAYEAAAMDGEVAKADVKKAAPPEEPVDEPEAEAAEEQRGGGHSIRIVVTVDRDAAAGLDGRVNAVGCGWDAGKVLGLEATDPRSP